MHVVALMGRLLVWAGSHYSFFQETDSLEVRAGTDFALDLRVRTGILPLRRKNGESFEVEGNMKV